MSVTLLVEARKFIYFRGTCANTAQSTDAASTRADETVPFQLDTGSSFEPSEPEECNALRNGLQDSGLSATSRPYVESASCPAVAPSTDETLPFNPDRDDCPPQQLDDGPSFKSSKPACDAFRGASQDSSLPSTSQPSVASASCPNIAAAEELSAADNAKPPKRRRNLKRTYAQSEHFWDSRCTIIN